MSTNQFSIVLIAIIGFSTLQVFSAGWRRDQQPKIYGDKVPVHLLSPTSRKHLQHKIVVYHNYFRSKVTPAASNMLRMKWHNGAALAAQRWADECLVLTHDNVTGRHIENYGSCGQNIFISTHQVPWLFAIKSWYSEKDNFTYGGDKNDLGVVGHYTQMVWATTHEVGCGFTKCNRMGNHLNRKYYSYICNYCPIGNKPGKIGRPYQKGKQCGLCRKNCHARKLCTNSCPYADYWANCNELHRVWPSWLCHSHTPKGRDRFQSCKATCMCKGKLYD